MGKFDGILICSDFDNTICYDNVVSDENSRAIEYFMSEGGLFTLATGRQENYLKNLNVNFKCNAPWVLINGTLVLNEGEIIYENPMSKGSLNDVLDILKKYPLMDECHLRTFDSSTVYKNINGKMELQNRAEGKYYKY
ncbi:MAG: HAD family phosphatase, partial [Clostridia bacterium]|nr:HAD family phosphatase [Clostridia bacterium]